MTKKFCLQCDDGTQMIRGLKDLVISRGSQSRVLSAVAGWHCPVCGDCQFDDGQGKRYSEMLEEVSQLETLERARQLRANRKRLGLRQDVAGKVFGGGATAFSEYERGKTRPPKSMVILLDLLSKHPEHLPEL